MAICIICGTITTSLVVLEYINGPTATSTTIKLVKSLELPAITICPKVPDALNETGIKNDIKMALGDLSDDTLLDVIRFWIGGNGLENMDNLSYFNHTYMSYLNHLYLQWSQGYSTEDFFFRMQDMYSYRCEDLLKDCQLAGKVMDCCNDLFRMKPVMRRGLCFQTRPGINQTEADDIGRLVLSLKAPSSITNPQYNYTQPQLVVYLTDNYEHIVDFPRFYLYPNEWNRMRLTARYIELIQKNDVCTNKITGRDAECTIRRWLLSSVVYPFNCTLAYLPNMSGLPVNKGVCDPSVIADSYYQSIQLVFNSVDVKENCIPGCRRWDYQASLQQSQTLTPFQSFTFNLEISYNDLQYEYVKEVYTTSVPGFMSQIGGQFGFFLGLSIITLMQMIIYACHWVIVFVSKKIKMFIRFNSRRHNIND
ncbi:unnamed protein product [Auanema sp. JU1783]|nr:unnamed protein product [Auanema sp. JU1783]